MLIKIAIAFGILYVLGLLSMAWRYYKSRDSETLIGDAFGPMGCLTFIGVFFFAFSIDELVNPVERLSNEENRLIWNKFLDSQNSIAGDILRRPQSRPLGNQQYISGRYFTWGFNKDGEFFLDKYNFKRSNGMPLTDSWYGDGYWSGCYKPCRNANFEIDQIKSLVA